MMRKLKRQTKTRIAVLVLLLACLASRSAYGLTVQDGYGYSAYVNATPLSENVTAREFTVFPAGITTSAIGKFSASLYDGQGNLWLIPMNAGAVIKVNAQSGAMTSYHNWPSDFNSTGQYKFRSAVYDGQGGIWMIPFAADSVVRLDTATGAMIRYADWPAGFDVTVSAKFIGGVYHNGSIYMVPSVSTSVIKLDIATGAMTEYINFPDNFFLSTLKFAGAVKDNSGNLWMIPANANMVVKMNLTTGAMTGYDGFPAEVGSFDTAKFAGGVLDGSGNLWLVPSSAKAVIKVNTGSGQMTAYSSWPSGITPSDMSKFAGAIYDGGNIWLVPHNAKALVRLNPTSGAMSAFTDFPGLSLSQSAKFQGGTFDGSNLWLTPYDAGQLVRISNNMTPDTRAHLSADDAIKIYAPQTVTISAQAAATDGSTAPEVSGVDYFRLNTNSSTTVTASNFDQWYQSCAAANKASLTGTAVFSADTNGRYWLRVHFTDGASDVQSIRIDNIYTPTLTVKGVDKNGAVLYEEKISQSHGLPLEPDGTLIADPHLGYLDITVAAKNLADYTVVGAASQKVLLNDLRYKIAPGNTITFTYAPDEIDAPTPDPPPNPGPDPEPEPGPETGGGNSKGGDRDDTKEDKVPPKLPDFGGDQESADGSEEMSESTEDDGLEMEEEAEEDEAADDLEIVQYLPPAVEPEAYIDEETGQEMVTYTLTRIAFTEKGTSTPFHIVDRPSRELNLVRGTIPAFTKGQGLTYDVLYKITRTSSYNTLAANVPAGSAYEFETSDQPGITEIALSFRQVPPGFAMDNQIQYTFEVLGEGHSNAYHTAWTISGQDSKGFDTLNERILLLEETIASSDSQEFRAEATNLLEHAVAVLLSPDSTRDEVLEVLGTIDDLLGIEEDFEPTGMSDLRRMLPRVSSGLSLTLLCALLMVKRHLGRAE